MVFFCPFCGAPASAGRFRGPARQEKRNVTELDDAQRKAGFPGIRMGVHPGLYRLCRRHGSLPALRQGTARPPVGPPPGRRFPGAGHRILRRGRLDLQISDPCAARHTAHPVRRGSVQPVFRRSRRIQYRRAAAGSERPRAKPPGPWFYPMAKYVFRGLALPVLIPGVVYGGIG